MIIKENQLQWFTSLFDKKSALLSKFSGSAIANETNYQLANELHKPIIRKFKKRKVCSSFRDNIWGVNFADMQSLSKKIRGISIYRVQLIFLVNMHGLFLQKIEKELLLLMHFKK